MKSKVNLSRYSTLLTLIITGALMIGCVVTFNEKPAFYCLLFLLILLLIFGFLYGPTSVEADNKNITVRSMLKKFHIPMENIDSVELHQPTMGAIRLCASGGYMGYWGIFREGYIGKYTAYYGKASDCFLIRMKNGDKYVIGCENPSAMVEYIISQRK